MGILLCILVAIGALCVGVFIGRKTVKVDGMFIVDDSDDKTTRWILDVAVDPKNIPNKKDVRLKVRKMTEGDV